MATLRLSRRHLTALDDAAEAAQLGYAKIHFRNALMTIEATREGNVRIFLNPANIRDKLFVAFAKAGGTRSTTGSVTCTTPEIGSWGITYTPK